jgi:hypothetical protein
MSEPAKANTASHYPEDHRPDILTPEAGATSLETDERTAWAGRVVKRYRDAYVVAMDIEAQGQTIKTAASIIAGVVVSVTLVVASQLRGSIALALFLSGVVGAAILWTIIHSHGVRMAAEGQHLLASLDVAVHTSPFLEDIDRAGNVTKVEGHRQWSHAS